MFVTMLRGRLEQAAEKEIPGGGGGAGGGAGAAAGDTGAAAAAAAGGAGGAAAGAGAAAGGDAGKGPAVDLVALRKTLAGGDADVEKMLDRYGDPTAIGKALKEQRDRIAQGFRPEPFPDKGTPEQQAAWRQANGIAAAKDDYIKNVGEGIVIGEDDKPVFDSFAEAAHAANLTQPQFTAFAKWYAGLREDLVTANQENDAKYQTEVDDALVQKYGPAEYRANNAIMTQLVEAHFPEKMRSVFLDARDESGRKIITHPEMREALFNLARLVNPAASLIPNGTGSMQTVENELAALKKERDTNYNAWMKNDKGRARERELLEIQARLKATGR